MTPALRASLTLAQAALVGTAGLSAVSGGAALVGIAAAWTGPRVDVPRQWVLPLCLLPALGVLAVPADPILQGSFLGPGAFRVAVFASLLASLLSWIRWDPDSSWIPLAASVSLMMAAGVTTQPFPYGYLVTAQVAALVLHFRPPGLHLAALVPALGLAWALAATLAWSETRVNDMMTWFTPPIPIAARFEARSRLQSMLDLQASGRVVFRVMPADEPPRYMVGAVYTRYERDTWSMGGGRTPLPETGDSTWVVDEFRAPVRDEVILTYTGSGILFAPRGLARVEAPVYAVDRSPDGVLFFTPRREGFDGRYAIDRQERPLDPAPLEAEDRAQYLQVPDDLPEVVRREAARLAPEGTPSDQAAAAVEEYFHEGFPYGKGYPFREGESPVEQFLTERPPAHCEFFATAMALMLRTRGIPTRYVTGFVVFQYNPVGDFFTVRENHAHAWVETWMDGTGWVTFDPTPPGAAGAPGSGFLAWVRYLGDVASFWWQELVAALKAGDWRGLGALLSAALARTARLLWLPGLLGALFWGFRRQARLRAPSCPPEDRGPLPPLMARLDGLLEGRGVNRPPSLTLLEWRERLADQEGLAASEREAAREFLGRYCAARYGRSQEAEEAAGSLAGLLRDLEESLAEERRHPP